MDKQENWLGWIQKLLSGIAIAVLSAGIIWGATSLSEVKTQLAVLNEKLSAKEASEKILMASDNIITEKVSGLETRVSILETKVTKIK